MTENLLTNKTSIEPNVLLFFRDFQVSDLLDGNKLGWIFNRGCILINWIFQVFGMLLNVKLVF